MLTNKKEQRPNMLYFTILLFLIIPDDFAAPSLPNFSRVFFLAVFVASATNSNPLKPQAIA
jgi:hypothetical protein